MPSVRSRAAAARSTSRAEKALSLSAAEIAYCAGATPTWRQNWATAGRLKKVPPFTEHDAVETAVAYALSIGASQKVATKAWMRVRGSVQVLVVARKDVWLVIASAGPRHSAVGGAAEAGRVASQLGDCRVLHMSAPIKAARERYRETVQAKVNESGAETPQAAVLPLRPQKG